MAQTLVEKWITEKLRPFILLHPKVEVKYCRLCLSSIDNHFKKLFSLFNPKQNIAEVIEDFAKVTISEEDQYSKFICLNCFSKLTESENFKSLIENSDLKLRNQQTECLNLEETSRADNECVVNENGEDRKIDVNEIVIKKETDEIEFDNNAFDILVEQDDLIEEEIDKAVKVESENLKNLVENSDLKLQNLKTECLDLEETSRVVVDEDGGDKKIEVNEIVIKKELITNEIELYDNAFDRFVKKEEVDYTVKAESTNLKNLVENSNIDLRNEQTRCHDLVETSTMDNEYINDDDSEDKKIDVDEIDIKKELESNDIQLDDTVFNNLIKREELIEDGIDNWIEVESDVEMTKSLTLKETETGRKRIKKLYNLKCPDCDKVFTQHYLLAEHMYSHTNNYPFHCSYCNKGISNKSKLRLHELIHTSKSTYQCEVCGLGFETRSFLSKHLRSHQSEESSSGDCTGVRKRYNLKCPECDQTFPYNYALKDHMITHTGIYPFHCSFCKKGFARIVPLKLHELTHTEGTQYHCEFCGKGFTQRKSCVYHMMQHKGKKPFNCEHCNREFMTKSSLDIHLIKIHPSNTEEPTIPCNICGKQYKSKYCLQKHLKKFHVPSILITCDVCGRAVRNHKDHMRLHSKSHKCTECGESFNKIEFLRAHSAVHTGKPFYECKICLKKFRHNSSLFKHKKTHDSKNYFKCEFCDKQFLLKNNWKNHLEKMHK